MRVISLFSGCGGLDLGFIRAGHEIVWANDIDTDAVNTYRKNIGNHISLGDITKIDPHDLPKADIVIGGFPCQGFSLANTRRSIDDERNQLYKYFYLVIKTKRPKFFVAENVRGILSLDKGKVMEQIMSDFAEAGYNAFYRLVNMADYGIPQTRKRVIIIGQRKDIVGKNLFQFPKPTHAIKPCDGLKNWVTIKETIDSFPEPNENNNIYLNHVCSAYKVVYRNYTGHRKTDPNKPSPTILARGNGKGGVCAIPHYNGKRRLSIRESATIQTFPLDFEFVGQMNSCYRQVGNAVPVLFAEKLGNEFKRVELLGELE